MKVVFFVSSLQSGGLENYLLRFLRETFQEFSEIVVFCKSGAGGQLEPKYSDLPNVTIKKQFIGYCNPLKLYQLFKYLKKENFDALCDFTGNFAGEIVKVGKFSGIDKRIVFYRGSTDRFKSNFLKKIFNNYVKSLVRLYSTDLLSNSVAAFNYFFGSTWKDNPRFQVIYNGINANDFIMHKENLRNELGIPDDAFVIGHTGRYNIAKNHETIIKVAEQLIHENPNFYFILCGNNVKTSLENTILEKGLTEHIILFENRTDIPIFLNTMNCYYFPSLTEGQPNALIEAMVMGIPIVASNIESIRETVPNFISDFLIPPLDVDSAKEKIIDIYQGKHDQNLQSWAIENYNSKELFGKFLNRFK